MFVQRHDGSLSFDRTWLEYKHGFSNSNGSEFWLGLKLLHMMTHTGPGYHGYRLRVDMTHYKGESFWAEYSDFSVGSEEDKYKLSVSGYNKLSTGKL